MFTGGTGFDPWLLWMDQIHFAPPTQPRNDSIPVQMHNGFPWSSGAEFRPSMAWIGFCPEFGSGWLGQLSGRVRKEIGFWGRLWFGAWGIKVPIKKSQVPSTWRVGLVRLGD